MRNGDLTRLRDLIHQLDLLRAEMLNLEAKGLTDEADVHPEHRASARNLLHYLALRRHDIRELQEQLAALGLSSLGRTESHVISALHSVMEVLAQLAGTEGPVREAIEQKQHQADPEPVTPAALIFLDRRDRGYRNSH